MARGNGRSRLAAARRHKRFRRFWYRRGHIIMAGALIAVVLLAAVGLTAAAFGSTGAEQPEETRQDMQQPEEKPVIEITAEETEEAQETAAEETEEAARVEEAEEIPYPFNQMSRDWDGEGLAGFKPYTIPQEFERAGGAFPEVMQQFTYIICKQNGVDYAVVVAVIEVESGYKWDAGGLDDDMGYMQIVQKWHEDRMERLNAHNLLNPFQNVQVGIDYLAELLEIYSGDYGKALTAYQYGASGAHKYFFSAGVDKSPYAKEVLRVAERIRASR